MADPLLNSTGEPRRNPSTLGIPYLQNTHMVVSFLFGITSGIGCKTNPRKTSLFEGSYLNISPWFFSNSFPLNHPFTNSFPHVARMVQANCGTLKRRALHNSLQCRFRPEWLNQLTTRMFRMTTPFSSKCKGSAAKIAGWGKVLLPRVKYLLSCHVLH